VRSQIGGNSVLGGSVIALFLGISVLALSYFIEAGLAAAMERSPWRRAAQAAAYGRLRRVQQTARRLEQRLRAMSPSLSKLEAEIKQCRQREAAVARLLREASEQRPTLTRVLGEEYAFAHPEQMAECYEILLVNRLARSPDTRPPNLPWCWSRGQKVRLWAASLGDVKSILERSFPAAMGFDAIEVKILNRTAVRQLAEA
jgi:hypothetical protein